jgi:hypothetical protein
MRMAFGQNQGYNSGTRMPVAGRISLMLIVRLGKKKNIFKTSLQFKGGGMNTQNYASLEACQRLVEAGIVLETEFYHTVCWGRNEIVNKKHRELYPEDVYYPAPSMAELWRVLPDGFLVNGSWAELFISKFGERTSCGYSIEHHIIERVVGSINPADALAELLMFVRREKV